MYIELDEHQKMIAIKDHQKSGLGFALEETVECLHCGEHYQYKNVKAIRTKPQFRSDNDFDKLPKGATLSNPTCNVGCNVVAHIKACWKHALSSQKLL